jgi:hypothetical protein
MEVVAFRYAIASRTDHEIVLSFFNGSAEECVAILKCSQEAARVLLEALGSALNSDKTS